MAKTPKAPKAEKTPKAPKAVKAPAVKAAPTTPAPKGPKVPKPRPPSLTSTLSAEDAAAMRSGAVAKTWQDPEVAAARKARNAVEVEGVRYGSVGKAFVALGLSMNRCVPFRMKLKAAPGQTADFEGRSFRMLPASAP